MARIQSLFNLSSGLQALWLQLKREALPLALAGAVWLTALVYFIWPTEPSPLWGVVLFGISLIGFAFQKTLALAFFIASLMWGWSFFYTQYAPPPAWAAHASQSVWVVGNISEIRAQPDNPKRATLTLHPLHIINPHADVHYPPSLRLGVWQSQLKTLRVGSDVAVPIQFLAPSGPQVPLQRDGRLWAWFNPTQPTAFATGTLEPTADAARYLKPPQGAWPALQNQIGAARESIAQNTRTLAGGVPTALLIGDQRGITPELREAYQRAGISHLIAISGMQLTLVGLGLFAVLRWLLASLPTLALRVPVKTYAAMGALLGVIGYTLLVGAAPNIIRAALMVGLVLLAVLVGRVRGVLRGWAWANILILAVQPHVAMSAGLQLSAAATFGLALWVAHAPRPKGLWGWLKSSVLATVLAGAFTAPVAVAHFGALAPLGVLGNAVALPLMTAATYVAFAALLVWPVGLEPLFLAPLAWLSELTTAWANTVAGFTPQTFVLLPVWLPFLLGGGALLTLLALLSRRYLFFWGVTLWSAVALWLAPVWAKQPQMVVAENGLAAWRVLPGQPPQFRLIWAEDKAQAQRLQKRLGVAEVTPYSASCCAEPSLMPLTPSFAWAAQMPDETWKLSLLRCARRWQSLSASCTE